jgi:hypothetical protein
MRSVGFDLLVCVGMAPVWHAGVAGTWCVTMPSMSNGYPTESTLLGIEIMTAWAASQSGNDFMGERIEALKRDLEDPVNEIITALTNLSAHLLKLRQEEQDASFAETLQLIASFVHRQGQ